LMGLIAPSFFGTRGTWCSPRVHPLPLAIGGHTGNVEQGGVYFIYYKVLYSLPEGGLGV